MNALDLNGKTVSWTAHGDDPRYYRIIWTSPDQADPSHVTVAGIREIDGELQGGTLGRLRIFGVEVAGNGATTAVSNTPAVRAGTATLAAVVEALDAFEGGEADGAIAEELSWYATGELDKRPGEPHPDSPSLQDSHPAAGHMPGYGS